MNCMLIIMKQLILMSALMLVGCSQTVHVKTQPGVVEATINGLEIGQVPPEGVQVEIDRGLSPVPYTVTDSEGNQYDGLIQRSGVSWWWNAIGLLGVCVSIPSCALTSYILANPALTFAPITCLTAVSFSGFGTVCAAPSPQTIPCVALGTSLGFCPSGFSFIGGEVPSSLSLGLPPKDTLEPDASPSIQENQYGVAY